MGLLRRLLEGWGRDEAESGRPADPEEFVLVDVRELMDGPFASATLEGAGIATRRIDAFDPVTGLTRCQIFVRRHAADEALTILQETR